MRLGIALGTVIVLLFSACANAEEEGAPESMAEMSADAILDQVVAAASSLASIKEERSSTSITHELPPFSYFTEGVTVDGPELPQESTTRTLRIQVRDDSYTRNIPDLSDFCDEAPEDCAGRLGLMDEELTYNGKFYFRDPQTGEWIDEEMCYSTSPSSGCSIAVAEMEAESLFEEGACPAAEQWFGYDMVPKGTEQAAYSYYNFLFGLVRESERLDDEVSDGISLVHIRGAVTFEFPDPYAPPEELLAIYEDCGIEVPTPDPEFARISEWMPDRNEGEFEMWIDEDFHIRRLTFEGRSYNGDRLIQTDTEDVTYSLFNEAALPGPLPSS